jgi:hypothetical protein
MIGRHLLRCTSPFVAQSGPPKTSAHLSAFEGEADMGRRIVPIISAAFDPERIHRTIGRSLGPSPAVPLARLL